MPDFWQIFATVSTALFAGIAATLVAGNIVVHVAVRRVRTIESEIRKVEGVMHHDLDGRIAALMEILDGLRALVPEIDAELKDLGREIGALESVPAAERDIEAFLETKRRFEELQSRAKGIESSFEEAEKQLDEVYRTNIHLGERISRVRRLYDSAQWLFRLAELAGNVDIRRRSRS